MSSLPSSENSTETDSPSLQALLAEKELRRSSQSLIQFTRKTMPEYDPAPHHLLIVKKLEQIERGEIDRLIITMPPRHGKSELASRRFPAWFIGRNPDKQIISCSYNDDFAADFGREVRNIVASEEFSEIFPKVSLASDSKAANRWNTNHKGYYLAAGVGGGITGKGAHILLIDDPFKDREDADSEVIREKVWRWYTGTAYHRLEPGGAIILVQTRWHDDDLAGRLLEAQEKDDGDKWDILNLPAFAVENDQLGRQLGEPLWPYSYRKDKDDQINKYPWYDTDALNRIKSVLQSRDWNSLYQQNPIPDEGDYFRRDWFKRFNLSELPKELKKYGASDYAVTEDGGDFTEHGVFGVDENDELWILDWWYGQTKPDVWIDELVGNKDRNVIGLAQRHKTLAWAEESGQIQKSVGPFIDKRQAESGNYFYRKQYSSVKDKPTRARTFQGRAAQGKVHILKSDWGDRLLHQLLRFPAGKDDDGVDVCSLLGRMLAELVKVPVTKPKVKGKFPQEMTMNEIIEHHSKLRRQEEWEI